MYKCKSYLALCKHKLYKIIPRACIPMLSAHVHSHTLFFSLERGSKAVG